MKNYTVRLSLTIQAESMQEAREIARTLEIMPKDMKDEDKIFRNVQSIEVTEEVI